MTAIRRYTFRLYPNYAQSAALDRLRVMACCLYNVLIEQRRDAWDRRRISLTKFDQQREMTLLANDPECSEWRSFPSAVRERVSERVDQAYKKYFENVKKWRRGQWQKPYPPLPPRFQKVAQFSGFGYRESPKGWRWLDGRKVRLQGIGDVKIRGRFPAIPLEMRTADILYRNGKWEISVVAKFDEQGLMRSPLAPFSNAVAANSILKTLGYVTIHCGNPAIEREMQDRPVETLTLKHCGNLAIEREVQASTMRPFINPRWGGPQIQRRNHVQHEFTTWLAAHGGDITVTLPPVRLASQSAKGTRAQPGALVRQTARANRDLLDRGISGFVEKLRYKVAARGNMLTVIQDEGHPALVPGMASQTARLARQLQKLAKKGGKL